VCSSSRPRVVVPDRFSARMTSHPVLVGRAAFETARRLYQHERVDYRDGARIIACSEPEKPTVEKPSR
jgi:hypothetical protein